ncbi:type VII secretion target [Nocardia gipuzkoensis]|uniref:type VII secretion target n=1 Tax=Nocardia gipuzkoensis TaxID=2749991 RepID=UPI0015EF2FFF|nr:type VII secretion target [Nocardia gipuzkoensis]
MPNYLDVEPDQLRRIAKQHDLAAANIRKWGEIPHAWLADFESGYGMIADPVRAALVDYYNRRHDTAERLAANHERSRDELLAAASALEDADHSGGQQITSAGGFGDGTPRGGPPPGASTDPSTPREGGPDTPTADDTRPVQPPPITSPSTTSPATPSALDPDAGRSDQQPLLPSTASAPQTYGPGSTELSAPVGTTPHSVGGSQSADDDWTVTPAVDPSSTAAVAADPNGATGAADGLGAPPVPVPIAAAPTVTAGGTAGGMPAPLATGPFAAAVHLSEDKRALPSLVVGEQVDDDLALARTLLAATLTAVAGTAPGLEWAVAVMRTPVGPIILLTSTEGRGWLPSGLFLPSEVTLPWRWDAVLDNAARRAIAALESTPDPARILAEFGSTGRLRSARISAMVSSAAISDDLRAALGDDVAIQDRVSPAESAVDFASPGIGLVDRLALAGSDEALIQATTVPDTEIRAKCLELARAADARVRAAASDLTWDISAHRAGRQRILDGLYAGRPIPASWWDEIRAAGARMAAALRSQWAGVSYGPAGGVHSDVSGAQVLRGMAFERRADELLLLLSGGETDRQVLRDALYAYGQIVDHPQAPAAVRAAESVGAVTAAAYAEVPRGGESSVHGVSVASSGSDGPPPSIAELLNGPAGSAGSREQRSAW